LHLGPLSDPAEQRVECLGRHRPAAFRLKYVTGCPLFALAVVRYSRVRPLDRVAQIAERKWCLAQARPFRLGFPRIVPVFPICPPAAL
jgi:hypothetical protein